jgi:hypothetical protein
VEKASYAGGISSAGLKSGDSNPHSVEHSPLSRTDSLFLETCILSSEPDILN